MKFPKLSALLGLKSADAAVTEENMTAAEAKIAQLEQEKTAAEQARTQAEARLTEATGQLTTAKADLSTAQGQVQTLEAWKKEQQAVDPRLEDDSNQDDEPEATVSGNSFEALASAAIAGRKRVLGEK